MNNELQTFDFEGSPIRTVSIDGEPWFVGKDVAEVLGYAKPLNALATHIDQDDSLKQGVIDKLGRQQDTIIINESGLYSLILGSKLPSAKRFKRWVTSEVLPQIRKHGMYAVDELISNPDLAIRAFTALKAEKEKVQELEVQNSALTVANEIMRPKAEYFDDLVDRNLLTSIRDTAKELKVKEKAFVNFLIDNGYLYRDKKGKLTPKAGKGDGLFGVKETKNEKTGWAGVQTMITARGRETFRLLTEGMRYE